MKSLCFVVLAVLSTPAVAESFTFCDGQTVCGYVRWRGKSRATLEMDGTNVFVAGDKLCSPFYDGPCGSCGRCNTCGSGVVFLRGATSFAPAERVLYEGRLVTREEKDALELRLRAETDDMLKSGSKESVKAINDQLTKGLVPYYGKW